MNLYETMNKKRGEAPPIEDPIMETQAVNTPQPTTEYKFTSWWQTPNYVAQEQRMQEQTQQRMLRDVQRAKRDRNMAIIGDLAKLGVQGYANAGGVSKIEKFTPSTRIANERLSAIRDRNAAQIERFARQMQAARQADAQDAQKRQMAELSMRREADEAEMRRIERDREYELAVARHEETVRHHEAMEANGGTRTNNSNGSANKQIYLVGDDGEKTYYSAHNGQTALQRAYIALPDAYKVKENRPNAMGINEEIVKSNPTQQEMSNAIAIYNKRSAQSANNVVDWNPSMDL